MQLRTFRAPLLPNILRSPELLFEQHVVAESSAHTDQASASA